MICNHAIKGGDGFHPSCKINNIDDMLLVKRLIKCLSQSHQSKIKDIDEKFLVKRLIKCLSAKLLVCWKNGDVVQPCIYQYLTFVFFRMWIS